jgi:hypothetical protein
VHGIGNKQGVHSCEAVVEIDFGKRKRDEKFQGIRTLAFS